MILKKLEFYLLFIFLWAGCSKEDLSNPIAYEVILEGNLSYGDIEIIPAQYLVFKNETAWNNFLPELERVNPSISQNLGSINFDFNEDNLIIIIGKYHYSCCSEIIVNGVYKTNKGILVKYKESEPGNFSALSQAYTLLKIAKEGVN